jgi:hypothetical protein
MSEIGAPPDERGILITDLRRLARREITDQSLENAAARVVLYVDKSKVAEVRAKYGATSLREIPEDQRKAFILDLVQLFVAGASPV